MRFDPRSAEGAIAQRELPEHDATIDALDAPSRRAVAAIWMDRAQGESQTGEALRSIAAELGELGAPEDFVDDASRAALDEDRHAAICVRVASRYAGRELGFTARPAPPAPRHPGASDALRRVLHVVWMCCVNETVASEYLRTLRERARGELVRTALRELLSDEVHHARLGWSFIASVCEAGEARSAIAPWIVPVLAGNLATWRTPRAPLPGPDGLPEHGCVPLAVIDGIVRGAMADLVLPGLERVGLDVGEARAWLDGEAADTAPGG